MEFSSHMLHPGMAGYYSAYDGGFEYGCYDDYAGWEGVLSPTTPAFPPGVFVQTPQTDDQGRNIFGNDMVSSSFCAPRDTPKKAASASKASKEGSKLSAAAAKARKASPAAAELEDSTTEEEDAEEAAKAEAEEAESEETPKRSLVYTPGMIFLRSAGAAPASRAVPTRELEAASEASTADSADRHQPQPISPETDSAPSSQSTTGASPATGASAQKLLPPPPGLDSSLLEFGLVNNLSFDAGDEGDLDDDAMAEDYAGTKAPPTLGSRLHLLGTCKPCAFVHKGGCQSGVECRFCHLCDPDAKKRRKKERQLTRRVTYQKHHYSYAPW